MFGTPYAEVQSESSTGKRPVLRSVCWLLGLLMPMASQADAQENPAHRIFGQAEAKSRAHYFGVVGQIVRPGVYEHPEQHPRVADLIRQAGGLTRAASGGVQIIRDGRPGPRIFDTPDLQHALEPGDLLVVETSSDLLADASALQIALVNLIDRPVVLKIRQEDATLSQILMRLNQRPELSLNVRIIDPAGRLESGPPAAVGRMPLASGTVLVFDRSLVDADLIPPLDRTYSTDSGESPPSWQAGRSAPDGPVISPAIREFPRHSQTANVEKQEPSWPIVPNDPPLTNPAAREIQIAAHEVSTTPLFDYETFEPIITPTIEPPAGRSPTIAAEILTPPGLEFTSPPGWSTQRPMPETNERQIGSQPFEPYPSLSYSQSRAQSPDDRPTSIEQEGGRAPIPTFDVDALGPPDVEAKPLAVLPAFRGLALAGVTILVAGVWLAIQRSMRRRQQTLEPEQADSAHTDYRSTVQSGVEATIDDALQVDPPDEHDELRDVQQPTQQSGVSASTSPNSSHGSQLAERAELPQPLPPAPPTAVKTQFSEGSFRVDTQQNSPGNGAQSRRAIGSKRQTGSNDPGPLERALAAMHTERVRKSQR
jgi:hypothetical protein